MDITWSEINGKWLRSDLVDKIAEKKFKSRRACLRKYGLTVEDYDKMLEEQGGGCAICGRNYPDKPLVVDHNHDTGKTRQLLCYRCNNLVGMFEASEELLEKVAAYCTKHAIAEAN